jgi:hypothetical protein
MPLSSSAAARYLTALPDRLALAPCARKLANKLVDFLDGELVEAAVAEDRDDTPERDPVRDANGAAASDRAALR